MSYKETVSCKDVMSHICESLGEELQSEKCRAIKAHLDSCGSCRNYFSSVEQTIKFYRDYEFDVSEESHKKLLERLGL